MISRNFIALFAAGMIGASLAYVSAEPATAQDTAAVIKAIDDALPGELIHNPMILKWETYGPGVSGKKVDAAALPSQVAISVRSKKRQDRPWGATLRVNVEGAIAKGDEIQVHYWVRTAKAAKNEDTAKLVLFVGRNQDPYDYIIAEDIFPSTQWELKSVKGIAGADFSDGELKIEYQLGKAAQTIEVGAVYVSRL